MCQLWTFPALIRPDGWLFACSFLFVVCFWWHTFATFIVLGALSVVALRYKTKYNTAPMGWTQCFYRALIIINWYCVFPFHFSLWNCLFSLPPASLLLVWQQGRPASLQAIISSWFEWNSGVTTVSPSGEKKPLFIHMCFFHLNFTLNYLLSCKFADCWCTTKKNWFITF